MDLLELSIRVVMPEGATLPNEVCDAALNAVGEDELALYVKTLIDGELDEHADEFEVIAEFV